MEVMQSDNVTVTHICVGSHACTIVVLIVPQAVATRRLAQCVAVP